MKHIVVTDDPILDLSFSAIPAVGEAQKTSPDLTQYIPHTIYVGGFFYGSYASEDDAENAIYNNSLKSWVLMKKVGLMSVEVDSYLARLRRRIKK